jgi:hypothetical protein
MRGLRVDDELLALLPQYDATPQYLPGQLPQSERMGLAVISQIPETMQFTGWLLTSQDALSRWYRLCDQTARVRVFYCVPRSVVSDWLE